MEDIQTIRDALLKKRPSYQTTNRREIRVRCPYCGDSIHDKSSAHFYIEMQPPFRYHCFKCEASGVLNNGVLQDLEIYDSDVVISIANENKIFREQLKGNISYKRKSLILEPVDSQLSHITTNYFNSRYKTNFSNEYITDTFKAITDSTYFFRKNNIQIQQNQFDYSKAIGFLSSDENFAIFRDITNTQKSRYNNLSLNNNFDEQQSKIYNIKSNIDVLQEKVKLIITEGIFDIIGVYSHFFMNHQNDHDKIFAAACGKSYLSVILQYMRMGFLDLDIIIFSDGDVSIDFFKEMKRNSPYLRSNKIVIVYNDLYDPVSKKGKDFGCPKADIKLKYSII